MADLYLVADIDICQMYNKNIFEVVEKSLDAGVGLVQYRDKSSSAGVVVENSIKLKKICDLFGVDFIINDRVDIALIVGASGVHVGQSDIRPNAVQKIVPKGDDFIVGLSTHSLEQIDEAVAVGVTYFNVGPIFHTQTKKHVPNPLGTAYIKQVKAKYAPDTVFTVMGGIHKENVREVVLAGADTIAVVTEIINEFDAKENTKKFLNMIKKAKEERDEKT